MKLTKDGTVLDLWLERDRKHVCLAIREFRGEAGRTVVEWWDEAVDAAIHDGFLDPRDYHGSAVAYANEFGLDGTAEPVTIRAVPTGWILASDTLGVYLGWKDGGDPVWSGTADDAAKAKGAWSFGSEEEAKLFYEDECQRVAPDEEYPSAEERAADLAGAGRPADVNAYMVDLDVIPPGRRKGERASLDSCAAGGFVQEHAPAAALPAP